LLTGSPDQDAARLLRATCTPMRATAGVSSLTVRVPASPKSRGVLSPGARGATHQLPMEQPDSEPDLRRLRYFVSVAEELSFSRAAERLYISQQPLSAAIQKLERDVGTRLFDRSSRRVALTAAGEALLPRARVAVAAAEEAYTAARNAAKGIAGVLRV